MMDAGTAMLSNFPPKFAIPAQSAFTPLSPSTSSTSSHFNSLPDEQQQVWDNSPIEGSEIDNKVEEMPTNSLPLPLYTHPTNPEHTVSEGSVIDLTLTSTVDPEETVLSSSNNDAKEITNHSPYESFSVSTTPVQSPIRSEALPPIVMEFKFDFYCLFSKPPLLDISDGDICFSNDQVLFSSKLTFFAAKIKDLFGITNDIVMEFADLKLAFYEHSIHTRMYSLHHLHLLHTALLQHSQKPIVPLRMLLLECAASFPSEIKFLTSLLPQSQEFPKFAVDDDTDEVSDKTQDEEVIISDDDQEVHYNDEEDDIHYIDYEEDSVYEEEHEHERQYHEYANSDTEQYDNPQEYDGFQSEPQEIVDQGIAETGDEEEMYPIDGQSEVYEVVSDNQFQGQDRIESDNSNMHVSSAEFYSGLTSQESSSSEQQINNESRDEVCESGSNDSGIVEGEDGSANLQHKQALSIQQDSVLTGAESVEAAGLETAEYGQLSDEGIEFVKTMEVGMIEPEIVQDFIEQDEVQLAEEDETLIPFDEEMDQLDPSAFESRYDEVLDADSETESSIVKQMAEERSPQNLNIESEVGEGEVEVLENQDGDSGVRFEIEKSDDALRLALEQNEILLRTLNSDDDINVIESQEQETDVIQDLNFDDRSGEFIAGNEDVNGKRKLEANEDDDESVKKVKI